MKNKLIDLNDHLFEQMERLNDDDLSGELLQQEIGRSKAMTSISQQIIDNASLALEAEKFREELTGEYDAPKMIGAQTNA